MDVCVLNLYFPINVTNIYSKFDISVYRLIFILMVFEISLIFVFPIQILIHKATHSHDVMVSFRPVRSPVSPHLPSI